MPYGQPGSLQSINKNHPSGKVVSEQVISFSYNFNGDSSSTRIIMGQSITGAFFEFNLQSVGGAASQNIGTTKSMQITIDFDNDAGEIPGRLWIYVPDTNQLILLSALQRITDASGSVSPSLTAMIPIVMGSQSRIQFIKEPDETPNDPGGFIFVSLYTFENNAYAITAG